MGILRFETVTFCLQVDIPDLNPQTAKAAKATANAAILPPCTAAINVTRSGDADGVSGSGRGCSDADTTDP